MLVGRRAIPDCQRNLPLRLKFRHINRLRIQVKRRAHLRVAEKLLNRLYVFAPAAQEAKTTSEKSRTVLRTVETSSYAYLAVFSRPRDRLSYCRYW